MGQEDALDSFVGKKKQSIKNIPYLDDLSVEKIGSDYLFKYRRPI